MTIMFTKLSSGPPERYQTKIVLQKYKKLGLTQDSEYLDVRKQLKILHLDNHIKMLNLGRREHEVIKSMCPEIE